MHRLADVERVLQARLAPAAVPDPVSPPSPPARVRRRLAHRAAKWAYMLVRPVVRPVVWRLRSFMIGGLSEQLRQLGERIEAPPPPSVVQISDAGAAAEMRHLAVEMERTLLTLALERGPETWASAAVATAAPASPPVPPAAAPGITLRLPGGQAAEVTCAPGDLSVAAALRASGGEWEPSVRALSGKRGAAGLSLP